MTQTKKWYHSVNGGVVIGLIISLIMSILFGKGAYLPVNPLSTFGIYYINHFQMPTIVALAAVLWGMIGLLFHVTSKIFNKDWSLMRMTLVHFGVTALGFTPLAILAGWFPLSFSNLVTFFFQYVVIYTVVYFVQYKGMKSQVAAINQQLKSEQ